MLAIVSFVVLNLVIAGLTWRRTRRSGGEFFLGRRRLTGPLVAVSVLMSNFSTEQLIGLNGDAFTNGATAIAWEAFGAVGLVVFAGVFLPRYYAAGVTTIPQYVEQRCGSPVRRFMSVLMVLSIVVVGLPFVLYSGTLAMVGMFDLPRLLGLPLPVTLLLTALALTAVGLAYALPGGMRGVAISDLYYALIFLVAAVLVPILGLWAIGDGDLISGLGRLAAARPAALDPFGGAGQALPLSALLTGMVVINLSAWCANQNSAQKAFAAASLAEGQKGLLLAATVKLVAPAFFVLPGMIAWVLFKDTLEHPDLSYSTLVHRLLPGWLVGFFAVAVAGATITSVSGLVHSATTLLEIDLRQPTDASAAGRLTPTGRWFAIATAAIAVVAVPIIAQQESGFYVLMKRLNAALTLPVAAVVITVVLSRLVWRPVWAQAAMLSASGVYLGFDLVLREMLAGVVELHWLHSVGFAFAFAVALLLASGRRGAAAQVVPREVAGWRFTRPACAALIAGVVCLYGGLWWLSRQTFSS